MKATKLTEKVRTLRHAGTREYCPTCDRVTLWVPKRRGIERCEGCNTRFPCAHLCTHLDCRMERGDSLENIGARGAR
jgi:hypothetical protein